MDIIAIDFTGHITVDKEDIKLTDSTGESVDVSKLTAQEICDGVGNGTYHVDLVANYGVALDGNEKIYTEIEES